MDVNCGNTNELRLVEHCSANAEATGTKPVEAPKSFFSGFFAIAVHCDGHTLISFRDSVECFVYSIFKIISTVLIFRKHGLLLLGNKNQIHRVYECSFNFVFEKPLRKGLLLSHSCSGAFFRK